MDQNRSAKMGRRDFLKVAGVAGGLAAVSTVFTAEEAYASIGTKEYDSIDEALGIDPKVYKRMDMCDTAFSRAMLGAGAKILPPSDLDEPVLLEQFGKNPPEPPFKFGVDPGYTQLDQAYNAGISALEDLGNFNKARTQSGDSGPSFIGKNGKPIVHGFYGQTSESFPQSGNPRCFDVAEERWVFESPKAASYAVKKAAKMYGCDLCGIAPYDERFVYATETYVPTDEKTGKIIMEFVNPKRPVEFTFEPKSVIVVAFEMDYESYKAQPTYIGAAATTRGYSDMGEKTLRLAKFLRDLGYNTRHAGNDTAVSVPLAVHAGLGEPGRMGLLITEEFGPRVRLAKIFTDLECAYDKPKTFGVHEFCEVCQVCADNCPSEAISHCKKSTDSENQIESLGQQEGSSKKWYLNPQKCLANWYLPLGGAECGLCVTVCPYNKPRAWNHDLIKVVTRVPGLNSLAKYFDEFFGYGGIRDAQTIADFWKKTI